MNIWVIVIYEMIVSRWRGLNFHKVSLTPDDIKCVDTMGIVYRS